MGLPLAALHMRYLGGALHLQPVPGSGRDRPVGAHASITFDATGTSEEPDVEAL